MIKQYLFVTPDGNGTGGAKDPAALSWALSNAPAGYTVWLQPGVYVGDFIITASGTAEARVVFRSHPSGRAVIDGSLTIGSDLATDSHIDVIEIEITNSNPNRGTPDMVHDPNLRHTSANIFASDSRIINCWAHDGGVSVGNWRTADGQSLVYGQVSINGGWVDRNRVGWGHGHGFYTQNDEGTKTIRHFVIGPHFGRPVACYSSNSPLVGFRWQQGAVLGCSEYTGNLALIFGSINQAADDVEVEGLQVANGFIRGGYQYDQNNSITIADNTIYNPRETPYSSGLVCQWFSDATIQNNRVWGKGGGSGDEFVEYQPAATEQNTTAFSGNQYHYLGNQTPFQVEGVGGGWKTWAQWQALFTEAGSTYDNSPILPDEVHVWDNEQWDKWQKRQGIVVVWNGSGLESVVVPLGNLTHLTAGLRYQFINAWNWAERQSFIYTGQESIDLTMMGWTVQAPIGWPVPLADSPAPRYGVFIVERAQ